LGAPHAAGRCARDPQLMDTARAVRRRCNAHGDRRLLLPNDATRVTFEHEPASESERAAAVGGWVAAFDRELDQTGDFAASVGAMATHGCFDVRAVVECWILANPTGGAPVVPVQPVVQDAEPLPAAPDEAPPIEDAVVAQKPVVLAEQSSPRIEGALSPDTAYFHSLLQGGIERAQIDEAFPELRLVIDEAVGQYESAAPILSDIPPVPSREDLNDEIRGMRQDLQASGKRGRRRWRDRD
jgi:hypothetical protein